jgi:hypothetical protein
MRKHKETILLEMEERGRVTAAQFNISNANVYLNELKREGICKGEWEEGRRFKWWYIVDDDKAERYLSESRKTQDIFLI